jgi:dipeptidyl aminopeptidase/acylaminoacyl peptidase
MPQTATRPVTANDLLGLRDVSGVTLSPDGAYVAFQVRQADVDANGYRSSWFVAATRSSRPLVEIGRGGEPRWASVGNWIVLPPAWSPDSRFIVYAALSADGLQLWRASRNGAVREQITHNPADVRRYAWSRDGSKVYFVVGLSRTEQATVARRRAADGVLLDSSVFALHGEPQMNVPWWQSEYDPGWDEGLTRDASTIWTREIATRRERRATAAEEREMAASQAWSPLIDSARVSPTVRYNFSIGNEILSPDGKTVAYMADPYATTTEPYAYRAVYTKSAGQPPVQHGPAFRSGIGFLWWSADGQELFLMRGRGPAEDGIAIEAIPITGGTAHTVFATFDWLTDCSVHASGTFMACVRESSTTPAEVAVVDLTHDTMRTLTRLNPEFDHIQLSPVTRLEWANRYSDTAHAHLIKPRDYIPGRRYPLVIVTYASNGFLRGGVGDEYPIQLFAAQGFAVLSFNVGRPHAGSLLPGAARQPWEETTLEWWSSQAGLEALLDSLTKVGIIDPTRIGITGLSLGARIVMFGISHSQRFQAAIASGNDDSDPLMWYLTYNSGYHDWYTNGMHIGPPEGDNLSRWQQLSPALNADRISTPLLMNAAGTEYLAGMQLIAALRERRKPLEMWIYPNELHEKWQPQHRLGIYERNVDWMKFWLRGIDDPHPAKKDQYERWHKLRELQKYRESGQPSPADRTAAP